jgi:transposase InsO family protein
VNDCSRKIFVYYLKNKSDVVSKFKDFKAFAENQTGKRVKVLRTDTGKEYVNAGLKRLLTYYGIEHELVVPYNPQQNGHAERVNRTIVEMGRCMIQEAGCSKQLWAEACSTAVYIKSRTTHAAIDDTTPEEKWSGKRPNLKHLHIFGCRVFALVPKAKRKKWDAISQELMMIGYSESTKGYRLLDPKTNHVTMAWDVIFVEDQMSYKCMTERKMLQKMEWLVYH